MAKYSVNMLVLCSVSLFSSLICPATGYSIDSRGRSNSALSELEMDLTAFRSTVPVATAAELAVVEDISQAFTEGYNPDPDSTELSASDGVIDKNVFTGNNRRKVTSAQYPWRAIGRLSVPRGVCTASLVGNDLILTNAHCVVDKSSHTITDWNILFLPNYTNGKSAYSSEVIRGWWSEKDDWAILRLAKPLGKTLGWLGIRVLPNPRNTSLFAVGYSTDFDNGLSASYEEGCKITSGLTSYDRLFHNCSNSRGASGSPLFRFEEKNEKKIPYIIALHAAELRYDGDSTYAGVEYSDDKANLAVPAARFSKDLIELSKVVPPAAAKTSMGAR